MPKTQPYDRPDYTGTLYRTMAPFWEQVADVRDGTAPMRAAGPKYLPKHPLESATAYRNRLKQSTFFNAFDHTLSGIVGMTFRRPPTLGTDVPDAIRGRAEERDPTTDAIIRAAVKGHAENIDHQGTSLDVFLREVFDTAAHKGHALIYVDMPERLRAGSNPDGSANLRDEVEAGIRPYWLKYSPEDIINWRYENSGGVEKLAQLTLRETKLEPVGLYGEQQIVRYRVLRPGAWDLYRLTTDARGEQQVISEGSGTTGLTEIPVTAIYGRKLAELHSAPPLLALSDLNIAHWQLLSDYRHILHVANVPVMVRIGAPPGAPGATGIGPSKIFDVGAGGDLKYVEHRGSAIGAARTELLDIEERMAITGMQLLARSNQVTATATEKILDSAEQSSTLQVMVRSMISGTERALSFHANYLGEKTGGSLNVSANFQGLALDPSKLQTYSQMVAARQMSLVTFWSMMKQHGELPEEFDFELEKRRLEDEAKLLAAAAEDAATASAKTGAKSRPAKPALRPAGPVDANGGSVAVVRPDRGSRLAQTEQRKAGVLRAPKA